MQVSKLLSKKSRQVTLYDLYVPNYAMIATFAIAQQLITNFIWNMVVFFVGFYIAKRLDSFQQYSIKKKLFFIFITTIVGAVIDIIWAWALGFDFRVGHIVAQGYPVYIIIIPIISLSAWNFLFILWYFKLTVKSSLFLGVVMGILTAPWSVFLQ